ncbi:MAG: alpha/beta hydrolase [Gammaproteobacteria bacterium]
MLKRCAILLLSFWVAAATADDVRFEEYPTYFTHANGVSIAYQDFGEADDPAVILVMGLGAQLIHWPDELVLDLADAGYRVIRFDNRDVGLSEKLWEADRLGWWPMIKFRLGWDLDPPYYLADMAADTVGLMDVLGIRRAHVVGASMGGMIAQIVAARYPERVLTLTSIMSTSGDPDLPAGDPGVTEKLLTRSSVSADREEAIARTVELIGAIGSPTHGYSDDYLHAYLTRSYDRSHYTPGVGRQLWAVLGSGSRSEILPTIGAPTLVIHGAKDPLVPVEHGRHTAELIPGAELLVLDEMGHAMEPYFVPPITTALREHFTAVSAPVAAR